MAADNLTNMDVNALLALRADVDRMLAERGRDLQRQLALLGGAPRKNTGATRWGSGARKHTLPNP